MRERMTPIEYLKAHIEWIKEVSPNQLFDAHAISEMITEAEKRGGDI